MPASNTHIQTNLIHEYIFICPYEIVVVQKMTETLAHYQKLLRFVHTLCSVQMFGSTQVLLKLANVSILREDPHCCSIQRPARHLNCTLEHVSSRV